MMNQASDVLAITHEPSHNMSDLPLLAEIAIWKTKEGMIPLQVNDRILLTDCVGFQFNVYNNAACNAFLELNGEKLEGGAGETDAQGIKVSLTLLSSIPKLEKMRIDQSELMS